MYEQMFSEARIAETQVAERTLLQRMEWHEISRMDRLENALSTVRARLSWPIAGARVKAS
jgi:hypothetical protein